MVDFKKAIITIDIGKKEHIRDPFKSAGIDYYCITDHPEEVHSTIWKVIDVSNNTHENLSPRALILISKLWRFSAITLPKVYAYDYLMYLDANILIQKDLNFLFDEFIQADKPIGLIESKRPEGLIGVMKAADKWKRELPELLAKERLFLASENYPKGDTSLWLSGVLFRKAKDPFVLEFNFKVLERIITGIHTCEVHIPYLIWKYHWEEHIHTFKSIQYFYETHQFNEESGLQIVPHKRSSEIV